MGIDVNKLDATIRRLQLLRELAGDPEAQQLLERFITPNGNGAKPKSPTEPMLPLRPITGSQPRRAYGQLKKHVADALTTEPQTVTQIVTKVTASGYTFTSASTEPRVSVAEALRTLEKEGAAKREGKEGNAFLWTK